MKNNDMHHLLERYREGTLSDSELTELNRLTHRDEVMSNARVRANGIVRRRRSVVLTLTGMLLVGTAVWTLLPRQERPVVAEAVIPEAIVEPAIEQTVSDNPAPAVPTSESEHQHQVATQPIPIVTPRTTTVEESAEEPVVICNNQCEADSVISDIWKFLTV